jgi:hypothetical protein
MDDDLWNRRFTKGVRRHGGMTRKTLPFLLGIGKISGSVHQKDQGNIEGVTIPDKPGLFLSGPEIKGAS